MIIALVRALLHLSQTGGRVLRSIPGKYGKGIHLHPSPIYEKSTSRHTYTCSITKLPTFTTNFKELFEVYHEAFKSGNVVSVHVISKLTAHLGVDSVAHNICAYAKPQNILLTQSFPQGNIKLCDFGFARTIHSQDDVRDIIGTPDYVAPEVLGYEPIHTACDMWSVGVLAYVLLTGYSPFAGDTKQETFLNISQVNLDFPDDLFTGVSLAAQDFIIKLLVKEPSERMTARECMKHSWLLDDKETSTPLRSPFGSPGGCRRALTPPSSDGSLELEPSKKCKCEESESYNKGKDVVNGTTAHPGDCVQGKESSTTSTKGEPEGTTVENSRGTVIICNGSVCTSDTMIENTEGSLNSRDTLDCEDALCTKENSCLSQISTIEQQLAY